MDSGFLAFIENQKLALQRRANVRAGEQQTGEPTDEFGAYWLERTAALEKVAHEAGRIADEWDKELLKALADLDAIQAPACREGDHETRRAA